MPLIVRSGGKLELTPDGARLASRLIESFDILRTALAELADAKSQRPLKVTLTPMFAANWLTPRLAEFRAEQPDIELVLNPTPELIDLQRENYDIAIRFGAGEWPGLEAELFIPSGFVIIAAPSLVEGVRLETPADLARLPWVLEQGSDEFADWLAAHDVRVAGPHDITHLPGYMILPAARDGQGVALASRVLVERDLRAARLVALFEGVDSGDMRADYYLVHRPGPMREPLRQFVRWLRRAAEADLAESRE